MSRAISLEKKCGEEKWGNNTYLLIEFESHIAQLLLDVKRNLFGKRMGKKEWGKVYTSSSNSRAT